MPEPIETNSHDENHRDASTVSKLVGRDAEGLRQLLQDYGNLIKSRLRKDFGSALDDLQIDEVMSAMTIKVWNAAPRFDAAKGTLRAWALVIARNCALRLIEQRRRGRLRTEPDMDRRAAVDVGLVVQPATERRRLMADLQLCIGQLPAMQRAILEADFAAGGSAAAEALAARFGTTPNSIYVSRQKGRKALRRLMAARGHPMDGSPAGDAEQENLEPPAAEQA